jgi:DNA-directed RNA polymerase subunit RPC12/RpoP
MEIKAECGNCGQHYSVDHTYIGEQIVCPNCNQQITVRPMASGASAITSTGEKQTNVKQGAAITGWICFGIGAVILFVPLPTWFIYIPLFLASFILSIVVMVQGRIRNGISLLLVNVIGVPILFVIAFTFGLVTWAGALHELARSREEEETAKAPSNSPKVITTNAVVANAAPSDSGTASVQIPDKQAIGVEKIEGAFNQKLGGEFNPSTAISTSQLADGTSMYEYSYGNAFRSFNHYYVLVTPGTHKIYSIMATANFENEATAEKEQAVVMEMLTQKYGQKAKQGPAEAMVGIDKIDQGNREVGTKISGLTDVTLGILYFDYDLQKQAEKERIANEVQHSDKTGL